MYIRRTLSCCICHVFHSVFSLYVHLMYISLSLFFVDGFYCVVLLDIVVICCCTPDNDVDSPSPDMGRHKRQGPDAFSIIQSGFLFQVVPPSLHHKLSLGVILGELGVYVSYSGETYFQVLSLVTTRESA